MVPPDLMFIARLLMKGHIECADKERLILRFVWRLGCASTNGLTTHTWRANRASAKTGFARWPTKKSALWSDRACVLLQAADDLLRATSQHSFASSKDLRLTKDSAKNIE